MAIRDGGWNRTKKDGGWPFGCLGKEVREKCDLVWVGDMNESD